MPSMPNWAAAGTSSSAIACNEPDELVQLVPNLMNGGNHISCLNRRH